MCKLSRGTSEYQVILNTLDEITHNLTTMNYIKTCIWAQVSTFTIRSVSKNNSNSLEVAVLSMSTKRASETFYQFANTVTFVQQKSLRTPSYKFNHLNTANS